MNFRSFELKVFLRAGNDLEKGDVMLLVQQALENAGLDSNVDVVWDSNDDRG